MNSDIHPVVLCGGSGSRLWPMSRAQSPKQFQSVNGAGSLTFFQATVQRHRGGVFADPYVVTSAQHAVVVRRQLDALQCPATVLAEPVARNTGPAVLAAALEIARKDPKGLMLVLPSDHVIIGNLNTPIMQMRQAAQDGRIVIFGIKPTYPETGYGYITDGGNFTEHKDLHRVAEFVEKPPLSRAAHLIQSGFAYWASGISLFMAETIIEEFKKLDRTTYDAVSNALERGEQGFHAFELHADSFRRATNEPTERNIFERSSAVALAPLDVQWSDVGCWTSMHSIGAQDESGNVLHGDVITINTENALVKAEKRLVAVVGMSDVIVVDTPDAVLVTQRGMCQNVKEVVETLKEEQRIEAVRHVTRDHDWGQSHQLLNNSDYDMSVIRINPGASISVDPLPGRQLISVHGKLEVFDGLSRRKLEAGERVVLEPDGSAHLTNTANDPVEALLVTMNSALIAAPEIVRHG
ncbi:mannose-1-phosphate guanylyltransferase/mannose-6-phosphate isomerase [Psychromarinibacter sp. S121]|uniref:mannose-1-phosphate guanylyltransferase/mannose-6-phosphate isomerase n=1 Tax=Psychromarinibacter sp. S121 TaxID=3415127 RepID=UPI003C7DAA6F